MTWEDEHICASLFGSLLGLGPPPNGDQAALLQWRRAYLATLAGEAAKTGFPLHLTWVSRQFLDAVDDDHVRRIEELERELGLEHHFGSLEQRAERIAEVLSLED